MKPLTWSLCLNVALAVFVIALVTRPAGPARMDPAASPAATPRPPAPTMAGTTATKTATDLRRPWLAQLRADGVPENVVAAVVASDFELRWQKQRRDLQRSYARGDVDDETMARFVQEHDATQDDEMRVALGPDAFEQWDKDRVLESLNTDRIDLAASEVDALYRLKKEFAQTERDLARAHQKGEIDEADFDGRQGDAEKAYENKLKSLLGDDRYAALKTPEEAGQGQLARSLKALAVTDAQRHAMLAAQRRWDQQRNDLERLAKGTSDGTVADAERTGAIDRARDAEYQRILGAEGVARLQETQDPRYQVMQRYAAAWRMSGDDVDHVYNTLQQSQKSIADYQTQAHSLENGGTAVDWPAVEANVQSFTEQTWKSLYDYLGDERFDRLRRNSIFEP